MADRFWPALLALSLRFTSALMHHEPSLHGDGRWSAPRPSPLRLMPVLRKQREVLRSSAPPRLKVKRSHSATAKQARKHAVASRTVALCVATREARRSVPPTNSTPTRRHVVGGSMGGTGRRHGGRYARCRGAKCNGETPRAAAVSLSLLMRAMTGSGRGCRQPRATLTLRAMASYKYAQRGGTRSSGTHM